MPVDLNEPRIVSSLYQMNTLKPQFRVTDSALRTGEFFKNDDISHLKYISLSH